MSAITKILALVSILAVALLGSLAIANRASDRDQAMRQSIITLCEKTNVGRGVINTMVDEFSTTKSSLREALQVAQREKNQSTQEQVDYARLEATVEQLPVLEKLPLPDCDRDILQQP